MCAFQRRVLPEGDPHSSFLPKQEQEVRASLSRKLAASVGFLGAPPRVLIQHPLHRGRGVPAQHIYSSSIMASKSSPLLVIRLGWSMTSNSPMI